MTAPESSDPTSATRLDALMDAAVDGIIVIDAVGTVQTYNKACVRLFGYAAAEVIGRNVKMLMPSPYRERHDQYLENYKHTGVRKIIGIGREVVGRRRDGSTFPMELSVAEMRHGEDHVFVGIIRDITERQMAERRLHELQAQLVHVSRVSEMGTMASAFAHELNQPLGAAMNYLNAVRRLVEQSADPRAPRIREGAQRAAAEVTRASQIIQRLRQFIQKGRTERSRERIGTLIEEATALALVGTAHHSIKISLQIASNLPEIVVDRVQIQQVLTNLIRNAVEAMAGAKRRGLAIAAEAKADHLEVSVADSGPGLPPEIERDLFKPFVTTKTSGMGVGLSICHSILKGHGGDILAEPNPRGGTVFRFTLPLNNEPDADA